MPRGLHERHHFLECTAFRRSAAPGHQHAQLEDPAPQAANWKGFRLASCKKGKINALQIRARFATLLALVSDPICLRNCRPKPECPPQFEVCQHLCNAHIWVAASSECDV